MSTSSEVLPDWVPESVSLLAQVTPFQNDVCHRLLTDARMKSVWQWLMKHAEIDEPEKRLKSADALARLATWDLDDAPDVRDQLCGAFFLLSLHELSNQRFTASKAQVETASLPWAEAAKHCRLASESQPFGVDLLRFDPDLRHSLEAAAAHLQWIADSIQQKDNPRVLTNSTGEQDLVRSHVRAVSVLARSLFGNGLYGISAKVVSVALDLSPSITRKQVEDWCANLPQ